MKIIVRSGTPGELEEKTYAQASDAKKYLTGRIDKRRHWASRFNREAADLLQAARLEIDGLDVTTLPVGQPRRWTVKDDYTGVEFVFEMVKEYG